jgi:hypothetical protein
LPEITSVDKNGRKSANWKYIVIKEDGTKRESIAKIKFSGDAKDVKANTDNAEYVTQKEFDRLYSEMKFAKGGQTGENFKVGDNIKVLGDSYTILSFRVDKSQGYEEQRVIMKNDKGEVLSYPLDMVIAYSKYAKGGQVGDWKEFYEMSKDTSGYNPEYEKKFGSYKYQAPHIQEILQKSKSFEDFLNRKNRFQSLQDAQASQSYWVNLEPSVKIAWIIQSGYTEGEAKEMSKKSFDELTNGERKKLASSLIKPNDTKSLTFVRDYAEKKFAKGGTTSNSKYEVLITDKNGNKEQPIYFDTLEEVKDFVLKDNDFKKLTVVDGGNSNSGATFTQENKRTYWLDYALQKMLNNRILNDAIKQKYGNQTNIPMVGGYADDNREYSYKSKDDPNLPFDDEYYAKGGEVNEHESKFEVDDVVYNKKTKTIGIVRMEDDKHGEVKTDADGNVDVDDLEHYNPLKYAHQGKADVAPSTKKEIEERMLWKPFASKKYGHGGTIAEGNYHMILSQAKEVKHHVAELQDILKNQKDIDAWVVAKMENASSTLSDITHYLDGKTEK